VPNSANLRPIPFERGNKIGERHGFYSALLAPVESNEIQEIADAIRELSPVDADAAEPSCSPARSGGGARHTPT
jgi:hypothetical protein